VPVWDQNQAQIAKARIVVALQEKAYQELLETVAQEVRKASAAARANARIVRFYSQEILPLGTENVASASRAYETGQNDILRLTQAQRSLVEQRQAYVAVLREYAIAIADLEEAVGGRLEEAAAPAAGAEDPGTSTPDK